MGPILKGYLKGAFLSPASKKIQKKEVLLAGYDRCTSYRKPYGWRSKEIETFNTRIDPLKNAPFKYPFKMKPIKKE